MIDLCLYEGAPCTAMQYVCRTLRTSAYIGVSVLTIGASMHTRSSRHGYADILLLYTLLHVCMHAVPWGQSCSDCNTA
jgi:hypothetical protein